MSGQFKTMRRFLFRLWNGHADEVGLESHRLAAQGESVERAYTSGFRDGYFGAVADLVREGMVTEPTKCTVVVSGPLPNHESIH